MYSSKKEDYKRLHIYPAILILLPLLIYACSDGVTPLDLPDAEITTEQQIQINVTNVTGEPLTGYNLSIDGPTTLDRKDVGESSFIFKDLAEGNYSISIEKDGYVPAESVAEVELLGGEAISHYDEINIVLQERSQPVMLNNRDGGVIRTAPSGEQDIFGEMIELSFSAGALPDELADESGWVQISADRILPSGIDEEFEGTVQSYLRFDPLITDLNEPVTIEIPVKKSSYDGPELTYTLQPGNIPLEVVDSPGTNAETRAKSGRGQQMRANAPGLQNRAVVVNVKVRQSVNWTDFEVLEEGGCGESFSVNHTVTSGDAGPLAMEHSNLAAKLSGQEYTLEKNFNGIPDKEITVEARNRVRTFTVEDEVSELNVNPIQFRKTLTDCHNSGGN